MKIDSQHSLRILLRLLKGLLPLFCLNHVSCKPLAAFATFRHLIFLQSLIILVRGSIFVKEDQDLWVLVAVLSILGKHDIMFQFSSHVCAQRAMLGCTVRGCKRAVRGKYWPVGGLFCSLCGWEIG